MANENMYFVLRDGVTKLYKVTYYIRHDFASSKVFESKEKALEFANDLKLHPSNYKRIILASLELIK